MLKLMEECVGEGELLRQEQPLTRVRYRISRYQGVLPGSELPIPGLHRLEGALTFPGTATMGHLIGEPLTLKLEDGRALRITLADAHGRVLSEGHGPSGCSCC